MQRPANVFCNFSKLEKSVENNKGPDERSAVGEGCTDWWMESGARNGAAGAGLVRNGAGGAVLQVQLCPTPVQ